MTDSLTLKSPAKLNLFLHITGRRADGYHELQTLFQIIDYCDVLHVVTTDSTDEQKDALILQCDNPALTGDDNLILRAARALRNHTGCTSGASITLEKHIPMGAGLGGGSSNAATTLVALNQLWRTGLDVAALCDIGVRLGADVPLFVRGESAWAEGIGEILTPVDLPPKIYAVITPNCHVSTEAIFSNQQLTRNTTAIKMAAFLDGQTRNDCENIVRRLYPPVDEALNWLNQHAPARMTGTGASVFAAFDREDEALDVVSRIPVDMKGFVAKGLQRSALSGT
ncbi:MAG: 4-(cytidine 5'-diphospho)-2-C-methyl-D-erythritol kinase [Gammaproteobacteria bacterium]|nr:4-(cytidine 5'-diphospho)-2-C-methyl-D-erythritol kinase [Gammaproteobacteria bacterium]MDP2142309.1 4-(cytidine 5'-diphospho)-2-C-methyl-D-erythritol kinase [Gammaproteobacteria bacterium]MDP2348550.1 4-(cytidine 5'-diphospho)-2-C-methyl-D-erythritol kinase [Gammaproteobacteria bacterium]